MRRWIFGVMVFVAGALASGDFEAALEQAKQENRALVVMVSTQGCPYCRRFRDEVLPRPDIQKVLREKIWLEVDKDKRMLPEVLSTRFVPSFFYFDEKGELVGERLGYQIPLRFLDFLLDP